MFKKSVVLTLAVALIMVGLFVDPSSAQNNVASTSKRGSLLVWPKIETGVNLDTVVMIGNDAAKAVTVKCYWMNADQVPFDFEVEITPYQPVWFSAKTGEGTVSVAPFNDGVSPAYGELKCWAITIPDVEGGLEILRQFNYLYGQALILETDATPRAFEYSAWIFNLNSDPGDAGSANLDLNGLEYDYCPAYLVYNFFGEQAGPIGVDGIYGVGPTTLSLVPCQQDVRQDRKPVCGKAKYDIWNENENKLTGAWQCYKCYFEGILSQTGTLTWKKMSGADACDLGTKCKKTGAGGAKFTYTALHTDLGRFRVTADTTAQCVGVFAAFGQDGKTVSDKCTGNFYKSPFLGVRLTDLAVGVDTINGWAGTTGTGAGLFSGSTGTGFPPYVSWDRGVSYLTPQR